MAKLSYRENEKKEHTHNFLFGAEHAELPKADVERGTLERPIRLPHHDDVDPSGEGGGVQAAVQLLHRDKHGLR